MPVFMFGSAEDWFRRVFDKNFTDAVQEVSPDEIAQIYMTILAGKPQERQRCLQELSMIHHSKGTLLNPKSKENGGRMNSSSQIALVTGVNHANAFFDGIMRARNFYRLGLDTNFPFIRLIKAIQDIHERRFASAIFTRRA